VKKARSTHGTLAENVFRIPFDGPSVELPGKDAVGSKAHNLMRLARRELPVPPGFVLGTEVCRDYLRRGPAALDDIDSVLEVELQRLADLTGRYVGDRKRPLLLSARSGAAISMPGMMETVLNLGLGAGAMRGLLRLTGNPRLAQDCRRRLIQQYGEVVHAIAPSRFEEREKTLLAQLSAATIEDLDTAGLAMLAAGFEEEFEASASRPFPTDPLRQIRTAIEAVLRSWSSERAKTYRRLNGISDELGTAVTIQAMIYGNLGPTSGSGVGFTRDPSSGQDQLYIDYLPNAQGEDVVSGRRTALGASELQHRVPEAYDVLVRAKVILEHEFGDMQDFEFTVEDGRLYFLQSRSGKRTALAALRIAHDLAVSGVVTRQAALELLNGVDLDQVVEERLVVGPGHAPLLKGIPAGTGVAVGAAVFDPERGAQLRREGKPFILLRQTAETGDIDALSQAAALVTVEGARTSHAAVVARQLGLPCVVGCTSLRIATSGRRAVVGTTSIAEGDQLSVDSTTGEIYLGKAEALRSRPVDLLNEIERWSGIGARDATATHAASSRSKRSPPVHSR